MSNESPASISPFSSLKPSKVGTNSMRHSSPWSLQNPKSKKASLDSTLNYSISDGEKTEETSKVLPQISNNNVYGFGLNNIEGTSLKPETTPLQDLFGIKNEANHTIETNNNIADDIPRIITSVPSDQNINSQQEVEQTNEERNQMTAQTAITNFEIPLPDRIKSSNNNPPLSPEPENTRMRKILELFKKGRHSVNSRIFKRIVKSSIAFFLATLLVIINPVRDVLGTGSYTAVIATIIFDSSRTVGSQLENTLLACICSLIGLLFYMVAFSLFVLFNKSYVVRDDENTVIFDGSFILALFLYTYIFLSGYIRTKFPKLTGPITLLNIIMTISFTQIPFGADTFTLNIFGLILSPSLIGVGI
ncbi:hypothetical protein K502DRAFT_353930, partial [Neoconidiobolus thromboides FSU 785]